MKDEPKPTTVEVPEGFHEHLRPAGPVIISGQHRHESIEKFLQDREGGFRALSVQLDELHRELSEEAAAIEAHLRRLESLKGAASRTARCAAESLPGIGTEEGEEGG